jgi:hypothetical protein
VTLADHLLAAVRARGSDAGDVRDAAHEACHAIEGGLRLRGRWDRETIHRGLKKRARASGVLATSEIVLCEIVARGVEQIVCADLGVACGTIEEWASITWFETVQSERIKLPSGEWVAESIRKRMTTARVRRLAKEVLAIADEGELRCRGSRA